MASDPATALLVVAIAAAVSMLLTLGAIAYARRVALFDAPGRRRSHTVATARGGGIGIVVTVLLTIGWLAATQQLPPRLACAFSAGLLLVAAIGWIDDHRPLPAAARLAVHVVAALLWVSQLPTPETEVGSGIVAVRFGLQLLLLTTAVNFWNFMDGINGLLASQSAWASGCAMVAFALAGLWPWALVAGALAAACVGFLPFNFPRARIFLGDVGSGGLGFACGALLLLLESTGSVDAVFALLVASALLLDAGFTLASRMLRGRRWYNAHREHLYQWMVRSGRSHAQTTGLYLGWNLILVLPLLWIGHERPDAAPMLGLAMLVAGAATWVVGKRAARTRVIAGRSH